MMETMARVTTKGQVTIPKVVRDALNIDAGDSLFFRLGSHIATVAKSPNFLDLAGSIEVPIDRQGADWSDIVEQTWLSRAESRR